MKSDRLLVISFHYRPFNQYPNTFCREGVSVRWSVGPSVRPSDRPSVCNRLVFRPTKNDLYRVYGFVFPCPVAVSEEICLLFFFEKKTSASSQNKAYRWQKKRYKCKNASWVHMHSTFKRIELESPGWSSFVENSKWDQTWATGTF